MDELFAKFFHTLYQSQIDKTEGDGRCFNSPSTEHSATSICLEQRNTCLSLKPIEVGNDSPHCPPARSEREVPPAALHESAYA